MKELTSGKPIKLIIGFALPVLLGLAFQQAYTLTDTIIIGRQLGKNSLAAVGSTASVVSLMFNIINGLVTGFAIVIAKNFGAETTTKCAVPSPARSHFRRRRLRL